jgi:diguanylate cyclase (GGDEF)-like protein/PAS domain S-box-containing protein
MLSPFRWRLMITAGGLVAGSVGVVAVLYSPGMHVDSLWLQSGVMAAVAGVGGLMLWLLVRQLRALEHALQQRSAAERTATALLNQMHSILATAPVGIAFTRHRRFEIVSARWASMMGYSEAELLALPTQQLFADPETYAALGPRVAQTFAEHRVFSDEFEFQRRDGSSFWGRLQGSPVDVAQEDAGTIWVLMDVTHERDARERLSWMATHDALTGLLNRAAFEAMVASRLTHRPMSLPAALLYIDIDHFKSINDTHGHAAGDQVLIGVADILRAGVRSSDTVARLGGDEFAVLLMGCDGPAAARIAEQMRQNVVAKLFTFETGTRQAAVSLGVAEFDEWTVDVPTAMQAADAALYKAKKSGRNTVRTSGFSELDEVTGPSGERPGDGLGLEGFKDV